MRWGASIMGAARDTLGREYYARGAAPGAGYRNGYRTGRRDSAKGQIEYSAPQIADRGLSTRDIQALFAEPQRGQEITERLWAEY